MGFDLVVRSGRVVDGTGQPAYTADVAVRGGRIARLGRVREPAARVIDADGLVVAPGFIDIHTHYDAQLHWEPTASPTSWHGVTTVVTGNCGFTLAPSRPDDVPWLLSMLSRVEGMSADTLAEGVSFRGGSLGEFAAGLEGRLGVNAALQVGHCALRRLAMGEEASERAATRDEIAAMQELLRAALREGAVGFTSSQLASHACQDGRPVPSNLAAPEELVALASVLAEFPHGILEFVARSCTAGHSEDDRQLMRAMCRASGRPMNINPLRHLPHDPDSWRRTLSFAEQARSEGLRIHPMFAANHMRLFFALENTFLFDSLPSFREALCLPPPERERQLRDPEHRARMRRELADPSGRSFVFRWEEVAVASVADPAHGAWLGKRVPELAAALALDPLDAFLEVSLAENLATLFTIAEPQSRQSRAVAEAAVRHPLVTAGSSDGGAHLSSYCGADYPTCLLTSFVPAVISLEQAIAKLTREPAELYGLAHRGVIRAGAQADLTVYDPTRLGVGATRWQSDFPAGAGRFVVDATGYVATLVNGEVLLEEGRPTGALPGRVLRAGAP